MPNEVHKNLRDKQLDSKTLCAAGLVAHIEAEKKAGTTKLLPKYSTQLRVYKMQGCILHEAGMSEEDSHELQKAGYPSEQPVVRRGLLQKLNGFFRIQAKT